MNRRNSVLSGAVVLAVIAVSSDLMVKSSAQQSAPVSQASPVTTAKVEQGTLSTRASLAGTLGYRARPDGSPFTVINQAYGIYTKLPENGEKVGCGDVLYRVSDAPVLLLCGVVPAYRDLQLHAVGKDVRQLNQNLHTLGYDAGAIIASDDPVFTDQTQRALIKLQAAKGLALTGTLSMKSAVFLPEPVRVARVNTDLGGPARPGTPLLYATSNTLEVRVELDALQQATVKVGKSAQVILPGNKAILGKITRLGRITQLRDGQTTAAGDSATLASISLTDPASASGLDKAPVRVNVTTGSVQNAMSVPVTALVGRAGGGFAVEVVRTGGQRELVTVKLGLFDANAGRVEVAGHLRAGDQVVVPSL